VQGQSAEAALVEWTVLAAQLLRIDEPEQTLSITQGFIPPAERARASSDPYNESRTQQSMPTRAWWISGLELGVVSWQLKVGGSML
jgi:hypothetical protein